MNNHQSPPPLTGNTKINPLHVLKSIANGDKYPQIADKVGCSTGNINQIVLKLAEQGHMERIGSDNRVRYQITEQGRAAISKTVRRTVAADYPIKAIDDADREPPMTQSEMDALKLTLPPRFKVRALKRDPKSPFTNNHPFYLEFGGLPIARFQSHYTAIMAATQLYPAIKSHNSAKFKAVLLDAIFSFEGITEIAI